MMDELRRPEPLPVPGPVPTLAGLQTASRRRSARQFGMVVAAIALLFLAFRPQPATTPELPAADVLAVLDEANANESSAETPPGTEILGIFDPPSDDPLLGDWSL